MIDQLLPPKVVAVELFRDPPNVRLFAEERALIADAGAQRRDEFSTARLCARRALADLGHPPAPILSGPRREPRWPDGVVGSITHCVGYRAAAVAHAADVLTIGIDAEPHRPLPPGVLEWASLPAERARLRTLIAAQPDVHWDRILFSAKESVYKAWYPMTKRWLGLKDADVVIDAAAGTFTADVLIDGCAVNGPGGTGFTGRWRVARGLILAVVAEAVCYEGESSRRGPRG